MAGKVLQTTISLFGKLDASVYKAMNKGQEIASHTGKAMAEAFVAGSVALTAAAGTAVIAAVNMGDEWQSAYNQVSAATGSTGDEMERLKNVMESVYGNNYGEDIADVGNAVATVKQQLKGLNEAELTGATESAFILRDVFEYDVAESVRSSKALMDNFGLSAEEAMNYIATGAQNGLDYSGELLDTISEYSTQFAKIGLSADDMFHVMQTGADTGAWNLDKVGDAIKELSVRVVDGSKTTETGFEQIGLNADEMSAAFAAGGESAREAFFMTMEAIGSMDDPLKQSQAGVNLFGTMWEDLGADVVTQLANIGGEAYAANDALEQMAGVKYDSLDAAIEGIWRQIEVSLLPVAQEVYNKVMEYVPQIQQAISDFDFDAAFDQMESVLNWLLTNGNTIAAIAIAIGVGIGTWNAVSAVMGMVTAVRAWMTATSGMTIAQRLLNIAMAANPVGIVIAAVAALAAGFIYLWNTSDEFRDFFIGFGESIVSVASDVAEMAANIFLAPVKGVIGMINSMIDAVNGISIDVPDWVPIFGGKTYGFNIPKIPEIMAFGTGGTVDVPQLAIVGDEPETIVPHGDTPHNRTLLAEAAAGVGVDIPVPTSDEMTVQNIYMETPALPEIAYEEQEAIYQPIELIAPHEEMPIVQTKEETINLQETYVDVPAFPEDVAQSNIIQFPDIALQEIRGRDPLQEKRWAGIDQDVIRDTMVDESSTEVYYITFQANIHAADQESAKKGVMDAEEEFERRMDNYFKKKKRVKYA